MVAAPAPADPPDALVSQRDGRDPRALRHGRARVRERPGLGVARRQDPRRLCVGGGNVGPARRRVADLVQPGHPAGRGQPLAAGLDRVGQSALQHIGRQAQPDPGRRRARTPGFRTDRANPLGAARRPGIEPRGRDRRSARDHPGRAVRGDDAGRVDRPGIPPARRPSSGRGSRGSRRIPAGETRAAAGQSDGGTRAVHHGREAR